ncbi:MAG: AAA family ATPase, partial [Actinomycetota bacterium]|nr:AAA family ATPase [Actinomycetota bacterium]
GQWVGRCPGCAAWGTIESSVGGAPGPVTPVLTLGGTSSAERRVTTGIQGLDRVLGGGLVPASVVLLAGEPGIGKSTLLLHLLSRLSQSGRSCLLVSGEESHGQVATRSRRLGVAGDAVGFAPGRDLAAVLGTARDRAPFLLAVDSIQAVRDQSAPQMPGGVAQVRNCTDALVGMAKEEGIAVVMTGHVTKDGDLAGPRALEHAVDVVLMFEGDPRSGLRVLSGGKNRFGAEGETAWFEMGTDGLHEIDPAAVLLSGPGVPGSAIALPLAGRRALAVEVQALVGSVDGPARRQTTGLDGRRFQLMAAVLARAAGYRLGRAELFGASSGGMRVDDPAADLAVAAALASAVSGVPAPEGAAFVGEVSLTGLVRQASAMPQRLAAAEAAGCRYVYAAPGQEMRRHPQLVPVRDVSEALSWAQVRETGAQRKAS